jgi:hypothetical protein
MNHELAGTVDDYLLLWFKRLSRDFYALGMVRSALLSQDVVHRDWCLPEQWHRRWRNLRQWASVTATADVPGASL